MSERDELIAYLRVCSACYGCGIGADGDTCTNCDDRRQPNRRAADLLERDGAEIARLRVERDREERECGEVMDERDRYSDALAESHIALGGDGEWAARTWNPSPPDSGDLARDVPALAAAVKRDLDEARAALAEAHAAAAEVDAAGGDAPHSKAFGLAAWIRARAELDRKALAEAQRDAERMDYVRKVFLLDDDEGMFDLGFAESVAEFNATIDGVLEKRTPAIAKEQSHASE